MKIIVLIILGGLALLAIGVAIGLIELAVVIAWKAPVLFLYIVTYFIFSDEGWEPHHVHVERGGGVVKYWLKPVGMAHCGCDYFGT